MDERAESHRNAPTGPGSVEPLPPPRTEGTMTLEAALAARASRRSFTGTPLPRADLGQLLWAGQGLVPPADGRSPRRGPTGRRTCPSAGATYPLVLYVAEPTGHSRYEPDPDAHRLRRLGASDLRAPLAEAALGQRCVREAGAVITITAEVSRTAERYGDRALLYIILEAGHAAQNLLLQATALGLASVPIGAFDEASFHRLLGLPPSLRPLYVVAVGHPRR